MAGVIRDDGACIPPDPSNTDWQEFLNWNATGGLDLSDKTIVQRRPRPLADLLTDLTALSSADREKLLLVAVGKMLQQEAGLARELGIAIDGDEIAR